VISRTRGYSALTLFLGSLRLPSALCCRLCFCPEIYVVIDFPQHAPYTFSDRSKPSQALKLVGNNYLELIPCVGCFEVAFAIRESRTLDKILQLGFGLGDRIISHSR
jgi:hypothetical protein